MVIINKEFEMQEFYSEIWKFHFKLCIDIIKDKQRDIIIYIENVIGQWFSKGSY